MRARYAVLLVVAACATTAVAQGPVVKPEWVAAHDLKVRKGKETDWEKAQKVGVELFKDPAADAVVAVTAAGQMAVVGGEFAGQKASGYVTGLSFKARTADEEKFTQTTTLYGVEVFKGVNTGQVLYVSDKGGLAYFPGSGGDGKEPEFQYGLKLKVRKPGEDKFEGAKAYGIEAYKDNNTGGMVYVTDAGLIATAKGVPDKAPETKDVKKPTPLYGLEAKVRKFDELEFTNAQKVGIEVFKDENTGTLIYISENGSIAAVPAPAAIEKGQKLLWLHAFTLKARPGGEADFAKARKYGVEVFSDRHTGYLVYVNEAGNIAVLPKK
jgi:hypothetical protein